MKIKIYILVTLVAVSLALVVGLGIILPVLLSAAGSNNDRLVTQLTETVALAQRDIVSGQVNSSYAENLLARNITAKLGYPFRNASDGSGWQPNLRYLNEFVRFGFESSPLEGITHSMACRFADGSSVGTYYRLGMAVVQMSRVTPTPPMTEVRFDPTVHNGFEIENQSSVTMILMNATALRGFPPAISAVLAKPTVLRTRSWRGGVFWANKKQSTPFLLRVNVVNTVNVTALNMFTPPAITTASSPSGAGFHMATCMSPMRHERLYTFLRQYLPTTAARAYMFDRTFGRVVGASHGAIATFTTRTKVPGPPFPPGCIFLPPNDVACYRNNSDFPLLRAVLDYWNLTERPKGTLHLQSVPHPDTEEPFSAVAMNLPILDPLLDFTLFVFVPSGFLLDAVDRARETAITVSVAVAVVAAAVGVIVLGLVSWNITVLVDTLADPWDLVKQQKKKKKKKKKSQRKRNQQQQKQEAQITETGVVVCPRAAPGDADENQEGRPEEEEEDEQQQQQQEKPSLATRLLGICSFCTFSELDAVAQEHQQLKALIGQLRGFMQLAEKNSSSGSSGSRDASSSNTGRDKSSDKTLSSDDTAAGAGGGSLDSSLGSSGEMSGQELGRRAQQQQQQQDDTAAAAAASPLPPMKKKSVSFAAKVRAFSVVDGSGDLQLQEHELRTSPDDHNTSAAADASDSDASSEGSADDSGAAAAAAATVCNNGDDGSPDGYSGSPPPPSRSSASSSSSSSSPCHRRPLNSRRPHFLFVAHHRLVCCVHVQFPVFVHLADAVEHGRFVARQQHKRNINGASAEQSSTELPPLIDPNDVSDHRNGEKNNNNNAPAAEAPNQRTARQDLILVSKIIADLVVYLTQHSNSFCEMLHFSGDTVSLCFTVRHFGKSRLLQNLIGTILGLAARLSQDLVAQLAYEYPTVLQVVTTTTTADGEGGGGNKKKKKRRSSSRGDKPPPPPQRSSSNSIVHLKKTLLSCGIFAGAARLLSSSPGSNSSTSSSSSATSTPWRSLCVLGTCLPNAIRICNYAEQELTPTVNDSFVDFGLGPLKTKGEAPFVGGFKRNAIIPIGGGQQQHRRRHGGDGYLPSGERYVAATMTRQQQHHQQQQVLGGIPAFVAQSLLRSMGIYTVVPHAIAMPRLLLPMLNLRRGGIITSASFSQPQLADVLREEEEQEDADIAGAVPFDKLDDQLVDDDDDAARVAEAEADLRQPQQSSRRGGGGGGGGRRGFSLLEQHSISTSGSSSSSSSSASSSQSSSPAAFARGAVELAIPRRRLAYPAADEGALSSSDSSISSLGSGGIANDVERDDDGAVTRSLFALSRIVELQKA